MVLNGRQHEERSKVWSPLILYSWLRHNNFSWQTRPVISCESQLSILFTCKQYLFQSISNTIKTIYKSTTRHQYNKKHHSQHQHNTNRTLESSRVSPSNAIRLVQDLIDCLTARQHRKVNLYQLRGRKPDQSAKDGQRDTMHNKYLTLHNNIVTQFAVKHSSYTNATNGYLIVRPTCLLLGYQARSHTTPYSIFIISSGADAV